MLLYLHNSNLQSNQNQDLQLQQGFTIIELLVVIIIIGILSSLGLPIILNQVSKARETEAKTLLGSINHAQQAHRFENGRFADNLNLLDVSFTAEYYSYSVDQVDGSTAVTHQAVAEATFDQDVRNYASGIYYFANETRLSTIICQANSISGNASASIDINVADCDSNSQRIR